MENRHSLTGKNIELHSYINHVQIIHRSFLLDFPFFPLCVKVVDVLGGGAAMARRKVTGCQGKWGKRGPSWRVGRLLILNNKKIDWANQ